MNNGVNSNNNFNGEVLGSVGNVNQVNNQMPQEPETLETLDTSMVMSNNPVNTTIQPENNSEVLNSSLANNTLSNSSIIQEGSNGGTMGVQQNQVAPEPAYTNPQNITPMPGFENSGAIGTTPPISLEPEKQPQKKKNNKTLFVIVIIILLFGVGFGTYYVLKYTDLLSSTPKITINTKNIEVNMGEQLSNDITKYADISGTDPKNCALDIRDVNNKIAGTYSYQITCGEIYKKGSIIIVDNTELIVKTQKVYKVKGETIDAKEFIIDINDSYTYEFVNQSEVESYMNGTNGTYQVKIRAISGTKTLEANAELVILEHKIKGYLTCESKEQNLVNSSTKKIVQQKFAIADDGNSGFGKVAEEIYLFKFVDETEYSNYLATYKTENTITIDGITGNVEFDDEILTITIKNEKTDTELINKYGESNMINYGTIRKYFMDTLGYECTYKLKGME